MKCAILQPSYIPWRGYFHQIQKVDTFVFYDDVQYDKHGWRNRNRIKTANGPTWLSIPVRHRGNVVEGTKIRDIEIVWDKPWTSRHWTSIRQAYGKAPYFTRYADLVRGFYEQRPARLADFTIEISIAIARVLGAETRFVRSSELSAVGDKTDRLVAILKELGATHYVSGPSARAYLEEDKLRAAGLSLEYMTYDYPAYEQLYPPYDPAVSVLDLLFTVGPRAPGLIWTAASQVTSARGSS